ncbi:MAG TPA: RNA-binding cell elongation regulator Jag/EloR [Anaerolineaceae bacterium]|nr:RNA-binding cell elongation regulator Jag/EloR [Anaerolineaceae bacterium]
MSSEKTTLEIIAPSVEDAISRGLGQLGLPRDSVKVEVLDAGSRGLFGLGGRQARVRLTILPENPTKEMEEIEDHSEQLLEEAPLESELEETQAAETVSGDENAIHIAKEVVSELLEKMRVRARVAARYVQAQEMRDEPVILVDIQGDDLSILIGRRSETLNALQYITSLIVGKEVGHWVPLLIDIQGYRARRERSLRQLARKMAEQAIHTGRKQVLEPMPASERRVIHLELRDHPDVTTESIGEEPNRKVTIFLKK